jgi:hypothetical protein
MSTHSLPLNLYVVYAHPTDFPDSYVVRRFELNEPTEEAYVCENLDVARLIVASLMPSAICLTRSPGDDPAIVEVWL